MPKPKPRAHWAIPYTRRVLRLLGLTHWKVDILVVDSLRNADGESCDGICERRPRYLEGTIKFDSIKVAKRDANSCVLIIHECLHLSFAHASMQVENIADMNVNTMTIGRTLWLQAEDEVATRLSRQVYRLMSDRKRK